MTRGENERPERKSPEILRGLILGTIPGLHGARQVTRRLSTAVLFKLTLKEYERL
jgi:hypothetical protein